ncbi:MAG: hypothetical protein CL915_02875 [Deltaproteobacteria bacterium]|nr:hypothetical protein [Deltaproteobacteria bacterium]
MGICIFFKKREQLYALLSRRRIAEGIGWVGTMKFISKKGETIQTLLGNRLFPTAHNICLFCGAYSTLGNSE